MKNETNVFSISIRNFQSLEKADIVLEPGLVIITGATNNGKSAIVRAIETAVFNQGDDDYVKVGTNELSVELNNSVHNVRYNRKVKGRTDKTTYQIDNGEVQQKVGRNPLTEVIDALNIKEVRLQNNQRAKLNFWHQGEAPFLMDKTSGQLYEFLSVSSSEKYLKVLKLMMSDIKEDDVAVKTTNSAIDTIKKELAFKREIIEKNKGFSALFSSLTDLNNEDKRLLLSESLLASMEETMASIKRTGNIIAFVKKEMDAIPMETVTQQVNKLVEKEQSLQTWERQADVAGKAASLLYLTKTKLAKSVSQSDQCEKQVASIDTQLQALLQRETNLTALHKLETDCTQSLLQLKACKDRMDILPKVSLDLDKQAEIQQKIQQISEKTQWVEARRKETVLINAAFRQMTETEQALKELETRLNQSDAELEALKEEMGVCPLCGSALVTEHNMF